MDDAAKKAVLRSFTYGLYAVTCYHAGRCNAFTANWLTQVSFDPPLLALSVENEAVSLPLIRASGEFGICVFAEGQRELAGTLGRSYNRAPGKLEGINWVEPWATKTTEQPGPPILADCLGYLRCRVLSETPAGDSTLLIAHIVDAGLRQDGEPLSMRDAGFRHSG